MDGQRDTSPPSAAPVTNRERQCVTLAGYCYAVRHGMKVQLVTPYRVSLLQRYGVTVRGNITSVYPPLDKNNVITLEHSPDLAPTHFYLFLLLRSALERWRGCDATDMIKNATEELKRLSQIGFQECFQHLYSPCRKYIVAQGDYFKRNASPISAGPTLRRRCVVSRV